MVAKPVLVRCVASLEQKFGWSWSFWLIAADELREGEQVPAVLAPRRFLGLRRLARPCGCWSPHVGFLPPLAELLEELLGASRWRSCWRRPRC